MASEDIPDGYGQWTAVYTLQDNARELAITCGYFNPGDENPNQVLTLLESSGESGTDAIFDASAINLGYSLARLHCLQMRGGILESGIRLVNNVGVRNADSLPVTCSIVVAKTTARAGRQFRGRFTLPCCYVGEDEVGTTNVIDNVQHVALQSMMTSFHDQLVFNLIPPVLLHSLPDDDPRPVPPPTPITSFSVRSQVGSDRRRLKRVSA